MPWDGTEYFGKREKGFTDDDVARYEDEVIPHAAEAENDENRDDEHACRQRICQGGYSDDDGVECIIAQALYSGCDSIVERGYPGSIGGHAECEEKEQTIEHDRQDESGAGREGDAFLKKIQKSVFERGTVERFLGNSDRPPCAYASIDAISSDPNSVSFVTYFAEYHRMIGSGFLR